MNLESELRADNGPPLGAELGTIEILPEGSAHFEGYSCPGPGNLEVNPERTIEAGAAASFRIYGWNRKGEKGCIPSRDVAPCRSGHPG